MRKTIRNLLIGTPALTALVPAERWFSPGNVNSTPVKPFVVLRWLAPVQANASGRFLKQLRVDVHEARGSYATCEAVLGSPDLGTGVYGVLSGLLNHVGADARITQCVYLGHSGDQEDVTYLTNMKFSSWRVIGVDL